MRVHIPDTDPRLLEALELAKTYTMTESELRAQRASWVRGEMGIGSDRDEAEYRRKLAEDSGLALAIALHHFG